MIRRDGLLVILMSVAVTVALLLVGYAMGRLTRPTVHCTSTLRVESAGPGEWTLGCEGGTMTCHAILRDGAVVGVVCTRGGRRAQPCACGRTATNLCDGRVKTPAGHTRTCNKPLCDTHAHPVGDNLDHCADCRAAATPKAPADPDALIAYCDGSGTVATRPSGAGVVVYDRGEAILEASRHLGNGTNNHAELSAIRVALYLTRGPGLGERPLVVRTDSMYAINTASAARGPDPWAVNRRLIVLVRAALVGRRVTFEHVHGHRGEPGNERADALAGLARLRVPARAEVSHG